MSVFKSLTENSRFPEGFLNKNMKTSMKDTSLLRLSKEILEEIKTQGYIKNDVTKHFILRGLEIKHKEKKEERIEIKECECCGHEEEYSSLYYLPTEIDNIPEAINKLKKFIEIKNKKLCQ